MMAKAEKNKTESDFQQSKEIQAAIDYGIDISMLIDNAGRSYADRIRRHQIALNTVEKLRKAKHG